MLALFAAYVVALQALVLPLTVAAFAMPEAGLCVTVAGKGSLPPVSHDTGCACAAGCGTQCCGQGVVGAAPGSLVIASTLAGILTPALALEPVPPAAARHPQNPRAPPAV